MASQPRTLRVPRTANARVLGEPFPTQVNHCRTPGCANFGVPARTKRGKTGPSATNGSYVVTLATPCIDGKGDESGERQLTRRLADAVAAARKAVGEAVAGDVGAAFEKTVEQGVSANLCEALAAMVEPFPTLDIGVGWALMRPLNAPRRTVPFANADAPVLRAAAQSFRAGDPEVDISASRAKLEATSTGDIAMGKGPETHHVVPNPSGGWDVKRGGASRASSHHETKREAIDSAREVSRNQRTELRIHNRDGRIAGSNSHGGDPYPPKG